MAQPFVGQIIIFGGNFAIRDYAFCDGRLMQIAQNTALFSLLGTTYGGDGRTTFGLPDLQGRAPMHPGNGPGLTSRRLGEKSGAENVALVPNRLPLHTHQLKGSQTDATATDPSGKVPAATPQNSYDSKGNPVTMQQTTTTGGAAHNNMQPYIALNFQIALNGVYPSRS